MLGNSALMDAALMDLAPTVATVSFNWFDLNYPLLLSCRWFVISF